MSCGISAADPVPPYGWTAAAGALAARARAVLDAADLPDVRIVASGGLDEYAVDELVRTGAPIDVYAVGTRVGVSADGPVPGLRLQDGEYDGRPVMKLSSAKVRAPGPKQVFRGQRTVERPRLDESRKRFDADLAELPSTAPAASGLRSRHGPWPLNG